ncbi:MAG TPA: DUF3105 domain-containing protein [Solirubrobacteraceae bacterium]|nr:DUF3105 domain-containing protein [Solirubrobacteraceae bacterium]
MPAPEVGGRPAGHAGGHAERRSSGHGRRRATRGGGRVVRVVEVLAIALASLALSIGLIVVVSGFFVNRDQAGVSGTGGGPGQAFADLGDGVLRPGQSRPAYNSNPPTSGPHVPVAVTRDAAPLSDDQLLQALEVGDVVIFYGTRQPPAAVRQLALSVAPPFTPALAAVGETVIIAPRSGTTGLVAAAWTHLLHVTGPADPQLRQFMDYWLGRGAPGVRSGTPSRRSLPAS